MPIIWVNSTVYMLETFTPKGRMMVPILQDIPLHYFIIAFVIYVSRNWIQIHIGTAIACLSFLPAWYFLPESPRWLVQNNKCEEAFEVLSKIAQKNGKVLTMVEMDEIRAILMQINIETQISDTSEGMIQRIKSFLWQFLYKIFYKNG